MTVALDASMLILLFDAQAKAPIDASTGVAVSHAQERLRTFLNTYSRPKGSQIAKVEGATTVYSDDAGLKNFAARFGIETIGIAQLPLSPDSAQGNLTLEPPIIREETAED